MSLLKHRELVVHFFITLLVQKATVLIDCVYKNVEDERVIPDKILVNGLSLDAVGCRSIVQVHGKYIFFLTKTPRYQSVTV